MPEAQPVKATTGGKHMPMLPPRRHALGAIAVLAIVGALTGQPAYADVSLAGIGMGHGAPNMESFRQFQAAVHQHDASGEQFRIDTYCPSACTMFLAIRNVCITSGANLAFHAGGNSRGGTPDASISAQMMSTYRPSLRKYLNSNHVMERFEFHTISGDEMVRRFGYAACR